MLQVKQDQMMVQTRLPDPQLIVDNEITKLKGWTNNLVRTSREEQETETRSAIDNLGEEIASDINLIEQSLKSYGDSFQSVNNLLAIAQQDIKICQMQSVTAAKQFTEAAKDGKFSETLVKQLLRQGEDRKTTVEETRSISNRVASCQSGQKRQKDQLVKVIRSMEHLETNMRRT